MDLANRLISAKFINQDKNEKPPILELYRSGHKTCLTSDGTRYLKVINRNIERIIYDFINKRKDLKLVETLRKVVTYPDSKSYELVRVDSRDETGCMTVVLRLKEKPRR